MVTQNGQKGKLEVVKDGKGEALVNENNKVSYRDIGTLKALLEAEGRPLPLEGGDISPFREENPPSPMNEGAYYGLPGEVIREIEPYSEACTESLLINFLVAFGNVAGRKVFFRVGADKHHLNLFAALAGETSRARKGMAWHFSEAVLKVIDEEWAENCTTSGLSSGEGLIERVRNPIIKDGEVIVEGIEDKRLLVVEEEFCSALQMMKRNGNILSPIIRKAWDGRTLETLTKHDRQKATGAHISIIGHCTKYELIRALNDTEKASGYANRFLWVYAYREKLLPEGKPVPQMVINKLGMKVRSVIDWLKRLESLELKRNKEANKLWHELYPNLTADKPGLVGAVVARAEAQVMRLAALYAVLDLSETIQREHLEAALCVWAYCADTVRYLFGEATGGVLESEILNALEEEGALTQTQIYNLFSGNVSAKEYKEALKNLIEQGLIEQKKIETATKPKNVYALIEENGKDNT